MEQKDTRQDNVPKKCDAVIVKVIHTNNHCVRKREKKMLPGKLQKKSRETTTTTQSTAT